MQSRAVIEQAKGVLMAQRRCDAGEAFSTLTAKLRDVAAAIVDGVSEPPG